MKILVLNGPNMNMLGIRQPEIYGKTTYGDLVDIIQKKALELGVDVSFRQSNHEGELVDIIQECYFSGIDGIVFNPAAYTHTSIAIADALKAVNIPTVEVHISDVSKREDYRRVSYVRPCCIATVMGKGIDGYCEALELLKDHIYENKN